MVVRGRPRKQWSIFRAAVTYKQSHLTSVVVRGRPRNRGRGGGGGTQAPVPGSAPDLGEKSPVQVTQLSLGDSQQVFGRPSEWARKLEDADDEDLETGLSGLGAHWSMAT